MFCGISAQSWLNLSLTFILAYFTYHTIYGDRGLAAYFKLHARLEKTRESLLGLITERTELEHKVHLLKSGDADFMDEQARRLLGVAFKNEKVFSITKP
jgi:cell division protein FtsB